MRRYAAPTRRCSTCWRALTILTTQIIPDDSYRLAFDDGQLRAYENLTRCRAPSRCW